MTMMITTDLTMLDDSALKDRIVKLRCKKRRLFNGDADYEIVNGLEIQCHLEQLARHNKKMSDPPVLPPTKPEPMRAKEVKAKHKAGSSKSQIHAVFLAKGERAAIRLGKSLNLSDDSVAAWLRTWKKSK